MVQLASKIAACISKHAYISRFFVGHDEIHTFHTEVSRLLTHATMLANYATRDLYILTRIPMRVRLSVHANLLASCVMQ